jgi:glyoxylase-like metal-dependent hydrolase (beta-lactamase superfamily II)
MSDPHTPPIIQPHFPNSAWVHAPERFVLRGGRWRKIAIPVRYCMFEHPAAGTCVIDTGYTTRVTQGRRPLLLRAYAGVLRPRLTVEALTSDTKVDVILISHLHADHVSGLKDHTNAQLYVHGGGARHFAEGSHFGRIRHGVFDSLLPDQFSQTATLFEDLAVVDCPLGLGPGWDVFGDGSLLAVDLPGHMPNGTKWPSALCG